MTFYYKKASNHKRYMSCSSSSSHIPHYRDPPKREKLFFLPLFFKLKEPTPPTEKILGSIIVKKIQDSTPSSSRYLVSEDREKKRYTAEEDELIPKVTRMLACPILPELKVSNYINLWYHASGTNRRTWNATAENEMESKVVDKEPGRDSINIEFTWASELNNICLSKSMI